MSATLIAFLALIGALFSGSVILFQVSRTARRQEQVARKLDNALWSRSGPAEGEGDDESSSTAVARPVWSIVAGLPMADEIRQTLREAGYAGLQARLIFAFINLMFPVVALIACGLMIGFTGLQVQQLLLTFILVVLAFLAPRWALRWLAARRRRRLSEEIPVAIQLLLMLMGAGLSIEHALRILRTESRGQGDVPILPEFSRELDILFNRVDAGSSLANELDLLSRAIGVRELSDLCAVLRQVLRRGGDVYKSLTNLVALIEDRRYTHLQEQAGEIAGKMSAVMIIFMFPALVLLVAGPGFLAVLEGLRNAAG